MTGGPFAPRVAFFNAFSTMAVRIAYKRAASTDAWCSDWAAVPTAEVAQGRTDAPLVNDRPPTSV
jgi:hypothetical protein